MERVSRESPSTRASSFSPRETYSVTYFLPLTKGPHRKKVRPFIYRGSHIRQLLMLQSPCVCRRSSARVPSCPLWHLSPPGVSLFRRFCCYLGRPHARHGPLRYPPLPGVSRSRRIGSHLRRVAPAPARHYGSGRTKTGSLLLNTKASQEAARFRGALKKLF